MFFIRGNLFEFSMTIVYEYTIKKKSSNIYACYILKNELKTFSYNETISVSWFSLGDN